jgi:hypothetical protein
LDLSLPLAHFLMHENASRERKPIRLLGTLIFLPSCKLQLTLLVLLGSVRSLGSTVAFVTLSETASIAIVAQNVYEAFALAVREPGKQFSVAETAIATPILNSSSECHYQRSPVRKKIWINRPPFEVACSIQCFFALYVQPTDSWACMSHRESDGLHSRIYKLSNGRFKAVVPCVVLAVRVLSQPSGILKN